MHELLSDINLSRENLIALLLFFEFRKGFVFVTGGPLQRQNRKRFGKSFWLEKDFGVIFWFHELKHTHIISFRSLEQALLDYGEKILDLLYHRLIVRQSKISPKNSSVLCESIKNYTFLNLNYM